MHGQVHRLAISLLFHALPAPLSLFSAVLDACTGCLYVAVGT